MNVPQSIAQAPCNLNKVTVCTVAYDAGWWVFTVPGEGSRRVIDSRQARSEVGMLMNPWAEVDPEDVDDWAEFGPCVIHHTPIPEQTKSNPDDADEHGDTSGDDEPDGIRELDDHEDDKEPGLSRANQWRSSLDRAFWSHVDGVQPRHTGTIGDDRMVRAIDRDCAACKAHIAALKSKSRHSKHKLACLEEMLADLRKRRQEYVNPITGCRRPAHRLFYTEGTDNQVKGIRMMLLRAIRSSVAHDSKASIALIHAISRGTCLGYTPDPHWEWRVMPFDRRRLPRLEKQADKQKAA